MGAAVPCASSVKAETLKSPDVPATCWSSPFARVAAPPQVRRAWPSAPDPAARAACRPSVGTRRGTPSAAANPPARWARTAGRPSRRSLRRGTSRTSRRRRSRRPSRSPCRDARSRRCRCPPVRRACRPLLKRSPEARPAVLGSAPPASTSGEACAMARVISVLVTAPVCVVPGGPCGPSGPRGPCSPRGPIGPRAPVSPCAPGSPRSPCGPASPLGPCGPAGPRLPEPVGGSCCRAHEGTSASTTSPATSATFAPVNERISVPVMPSASSSQVSGGLELDLRLHVGGRVAPDDLRCAGLQLGARTDVAAPARRRGAGSCPRYRSTGCALRRRTPRPCDCRSGSRRSSP